jgi:hypothetical protein
MFQWSKRWLVLFQIKATCKVWAVWVYLVELVGWWLDPVILVKNKIVLSFGWCLLLSLLLLISLWSYRWVTVPLIAAHGIIGLLFLITILFFLLILLSCSLLLFKVIIFIYIGFLLLFLVVWSHVITLIRVQRVHVISQITFELILHWTLWIWFLFSIALTWLLVVLIGAILIALKGSHLRVLDLGCHGTMIWGSLNWLIWWSVGILNVFFSEGTFLSSMRYGWLHRLIVLWRRWKLIATIFESCWGLMTMRCSRNV